MKEISFYKISDSEYSFNYRGITVIFTDIIFNPEIDRYVFKYGDNEICHINAKLYYINEVN